jgi:triphosphoribosyl-dephospho-CoA synthase
MTAETFLRSIAALRGYFRAISACGVAARPFVELEQLGIAAERRMLEATGGVNTHRGAVFALGLLCAAADHALSADDLRRRLLALWGADLRARVRTDAVSHGQRVAQRHGLRGARAEAAAGFPVLFDHAVPALREARACGLDDRRAHLQAFFVAMAELDDTNLVHRAGLEGLRYARNAAKGFLVAGGAYAPEAIVRAGRLHHAFVERRLSPGGAADVLAAASWVVRICG